MSMKMNTPGTEVAILTPFDKNLEVDYDALRKEIDYTVNICKAGAIGVAAIESQEYQYLSFEKRKELIVESIKSIAERSFVSVGVSHPSAKIAKELVELAESNGADAIQLLIPNKPYGGKPGQAEVLNYFKEISQLSSLPIVAYYNPGPGAEVSIETLAKIGEIDNVQYLKYNSWNIREVASVLEQMEQERNIHVFVPMEMLLPALMLGASGGALPIPVAYLGHELIDLYSRGKINEAIEIQKKFYGFPGKWRAYGHPRIMKFVMKHIVGIDLGGAHPPFDAMDGVDISELLRKASEMGFPKA